ncbi:MAG: hypothetical protein U0325_18435 [Polyangiales bacterium]
MSPSYRDDRPSLLASLDELRRENEELRAENFTLRVLADPPSSQRSLARMQGALTATLVVSVAMLAAALVTREPALWMDPPSAYAHTHAPRDLPDDLPPPPRAPAPPPAVTACAPAPVTADAPTDAPTDAAPAPDALRAAMLPLRPALARCLQGTHGSYHLDVSLDGAGVVRTATIRPRTGPALSSASSLCAQTAAAALRLDVEGPTALRYTLRMRGDELRVRRVRRL